MPLRKAPLASMTSTLVDGSTSTVAPKMHPVAKVTVRAVNVRRVEKHL